jgi:hypothetical protein
MLTSRMIKRWCMPFLITFLLSMLLPVYNASAASDFVTQTDRAYTWLSAQQDLTAGFALDGLVDSFDDWWNTTDRKQNAYTYDQAVAAIAFMLKNDRTRAEKVLNKMRDMQDPDGSWVNSYWWNNGAGEEIRKHVGPVAWMAMAYMAYEVKYNDTRYQPTVKKALDWCITFQKPNGGISGGRTTWDSGNGSWTDEVWSSTEHNEDIYNLLRIYANKFPDRTSTYNNVANNVKNFLDNVVWNDSLKRWNGGWKNNTGLIDPNVPMDVNPWGVMALGLSGTRDYFSAVNYVDNANGSGTISSPKYVQTLTYDGAGNLLTGYDFDWQYDCAAADPGQKCADVWFEGSFFMASAHYMNGNTAKYNSIMNELIKKQGTSGSLLGGLPYSLKGSNNNYWQMAMENCVSSTGWLIIAGEHFNPFTATYMSGTGGGTSGGIGGVGSGTFKLKNVATGLYLDGMGRTANGSNAGQWSSSSSNNQRWVLESNGTNYKLKNVATSLYLDGMGRTANDSICGQWSNGTSNNQRWLLEAVGGGNYRIKNVASGLYLDNGGSTANGADMKLRTISSNTSQQWQLVTP